MKKYRIIILKQTQNSGPLDYKEDRIGYSDNLPEVGKVFIVRDGKRQLQTSVVMKVTHIDHKEIEVKTLHSTYSVFYEVFPE